MNWQETRADHRRVSLDAVLAVVMAAVVVLATTQAARGPDSAAPLGINKESAPTVAADGRLSGDAEAETEQSLHNPARVPFTPSRPDIHVPEAEPLVVQGPASGATVVILGDSYSTGWKGAGVGSRGWPELVAGARGWRAVNLAVAGTGFINPGWANQPVGALVAKAILLEPDVVFVAAGHNDSKWSASSTAGAADAVIDRLHRALPDALLVVIAPIWPSGHPPARCLALRDALRSKASSVGATFVDPLADGWFAGSARGLIGSDGIHPTDAGHRAIAEHVLAAIGGG